MATAVPADADAVAIGPDGGVVGTDEEPVYPIPAASGPFYGQLMLAGHVYPIGGGGQAFGGGGPVTRAFLNVDGLATTPAGAVLLADRFNLRIRSNAPSRDLKAASRRARQDNSKRREIPGPVPAAMPMVVSCGCSLSTSASRALTRGRPSR